MRAREHTRRRKRDLKKKKNKIRKEKQNGKKTKQNRLPLDRTWSELSRPQRRIRISLRWHTKQLRQKERKKERERECNENYSVKIDPQTATVHAAALFRANTFDVEKVALAPPPMRWAVVYRPDCIVAVEELERATSDQETMICFLLITT